MHWSCIDRTVCHPVVLHDLHRPQGVMPPAVAEEDFPRLVPPRVGDGAEGQTGGIVGAVIHDDQVVVMKTAVEAVQVMSEDQVGVAIGTNLRTVRLGINRMMVCPLVGVCITPTAVKIVPIIRRRVPIRVILLVMEAALVVEAGVTMQHLVSIILRLMLLPGMGMILAIAVTMEVRVLILTCNSKRGGDPRVDLSGSRKTRLQATSISYQERRKEQRKYNPSIDPFLNT